MNVILFVGRGGAAACRPTFYPEVVNDRSSRLGNLERWCPIVFERALLNVAGAYMDHKKDTITLKFGREKLELLFLAIRIKPYPKEPKEEEEKSIAQLAAIHFSTSKEGL